MTLVMRYAARSDVGLIRPGNEDSGYAGPDLLVVADGMGGHAAGELASASAVATFASLEATWSVDDPADDVLTTLADGVARATAALQSCIEEDPDLEGMGTTLTALAWHDGRLGLVHVGDSRGYLLRDVELAQITHDHTYVQMLVDSGRITSDEAAVHARRNLLMRAIDGVRPAEPDLQAREARAGDRYLLCSDGLSGVVPFDEIARLLGTGDPTYAVTALVERALELGAPDNVTAVVAEVVDVTEEEAAAVEATTPVVVGAAGERRVRDRLPGITFPADAEPDPDSLPAAAPSDEPVEWAGADDADNAGPVPAAASPRPPRRRPRTRSLVAVGVAILALALISTGVMLWARSQYYVGTSAGYVAVYRGLPASIGGLALSQPTETSTIAVTALPSLAQDSLATRIPAAGLDDARAIVSRLGSEASECAATPTRTGCPSAVVVTPQPFTTTSAPTSPAPATDTVTTAAPVASLSGAP